MSSEQYFYLPDFAKFYKKQNDVVKKKKRDILVISLILFIVVILVGAFFYRYLFEMSWIDSFYSASTVISTLSLSGENASRTNSQKIFIIIYALVAGILFITIASHVIEEIIDMYENKTLF